MTFTMAPLSLSEGREVGISEEEEEGLPLNTELHSWSHPLRSQQARG